MKYLGVYDAKMYSGIQDSLQEAYNILVIGAKASKDYEPDSFFQYCKFYELKDITEKLQLEPAKIIMNKGRKINEPRT